MYRLIRRSTAAYRSLSKAVCTVMIRVIAVLLVALAPVVPAWSQADHGTVVGTITDTTGAVIPDVQVTATDILTGTQFKGTSNQVGIYTISNLPIATYTIHYDKPGYKTFDRTGVAIQVQQRALIDIRMQVGSQAQTITVNATPVLEMQTDLGTNLTSQVVTDLPLTADGGRDITAFAFSITPTVSGNEYQGYVGGSQAFSKEVLIDGTSSDSGQVGHIGETEPSMDAVSQFQIDTSGISAEAGRTGGGAFLFSLKSGTNSVHGSAFGFLGNEFLNANTWDNDYFRAYYDSTDPANSAAYNAEYRKPTSRYFDYGGSAGGPIWRNHMFIFGAIERYQQSDFATANGAQTVPTTAFLQGDFSSLLETNKAPVGTDPAGNPIYAGAIFNPATGDVFAGNIIPKEDISPISQGIISVYAQYYQPTFKDRTTDNYPALRNADPQFTQTQLSFKYDWDVTPKNRITSSYIYTLRPRYNTTLTGNGLFAAGTTTGGPLAPGGVQTTIGNAYRLSDTFTATPNLLNVFSLTFNGFTNKAAAFTSIAGNTNWAKQFGFGAYQSVPNVPVISFGGAVNGISEDTVGNAYTPGNGYVAYNEILNDTVTWTRGRHDVKLGLELRGIGLNSHSNSGDLHFNFSNLTGTPKSAAIQSVTGFGFANFLLGDVYSASQDTPFNQYGRREEYAFFGEDSITVTPKLRIDVALRWDIAMPEHEKYGHWSNFTTTAKNPNFGSYLGSIQYLTNSSQTFEINQNFWQFSPHVGASYQLTSKLVMRGSYGLYYVPLGNNTYGAVPYASSTGYQAINEINPPSLANSYQFNWNNGYPGKSVLNAPNNNSTYVPYGPASVDPDTLTMGYSQNWNVNAQYQIGKTMVLQASYIGNIGRKLHDGELNPLNWPTWQRYSSLYNSGHVYDYIYDAGTAQAAGVSYPYSGWGGEAYQAINPYPQVADTYGPVYFVNSPLGTSEYQAFVFEVTKRDANGLSMDLSYTGSRSTGNSSTAFVDTYSASQGYQDPYQYKHYASYPDTYLPTQVVKGYVNYQLPFGRGQRFLSHTRTEDLLAGGWLTGVIVTYQSGDPIGAVYAQNYYPGWSAVWTNLAANASFKNPFKKIDLINPSNPSSLFVNPANFSNPPDGQLGNSPVAYGSWHSWGYNDEDASLLKRFGFGSADRFGLTLRADFFNVTNRHYWAFPNLSMGNPYFGHVTDTTGNPRVGQLGARFEW